jgi:hypothetical protein
MAYKIFTKQINDNLYTIQAFTGTTGLSLMFELGGYLSNGLKLLDGVSSSSLDSTPSQFFAQILFSGALDKVIDSMQSLLIKKETRDDLVVFLKRLVANTSVQTSDGKNYSLNNDIHFDMIFSTNYEDLFVLIKEVIVTNFFSQPFIQKLISDKKS